MLPESKLDLDNYGNGPKELERSCLDRLAELESQKAKCKDKTQRRAINKHMHTLRDMVKWCRTRAGYVGSGNV